jgi:phosphohistidine phosphatase SixA
VAKGCGCEDEIILYKSLYAAEPQAYFEVLHDISDNYDKVLVVGHNPGTRDPN